MLKNYMLFALKAKTWTSIGWTSSVVDALLEVHGEGPVAALSAPPGMPADRLVGLTKSLANTISSWHLKPGHQRDVSWPRIFELMAAAFPKDSFCIWHSEQDEALARCRRTPVVSGDKDAYVKAFVQTGLSKVDKADVWAFREWNPKAGALYQPGAVNEGRCESSQADIT